MSQLIFLSQIISGIILIVLILLQQKGTGLGTAFGGEISFYSTRRGAEKLIFYLTIITAAAFILLSILGLFV